MNYHSRKSRKRNRRQRAVAGATAGSNITDRWGWGDPAPQLIGDLVLIRQAIREAWLVPEASRDSIVRAMMDVLDHAETPDRVKISVVRAVLDMELANMLCDCTTLAKRRRLLASKTEAWRAWALRVDDMGTA